MGGYAFKTDDPKLTPVNILKLVILFFVCEGVSVGIGLGGAFLHMVILVSFLGMNPKVASGTIMYIGLYSPPTASLQYIL